MAIVNRTRDSFYDRGATCAEDKALERVRAVVAEGAEIVDIGGVKAGPGEEVDVAEEIRRTVPFVAAVRAEFPDLVISVDTWRAEVGREVCRGGRRPAQRRVGRLRPARWPRWPPSTAPRWSARTPTAPPRGRRRTARRTTTWWPPRSRTPSRSPSGRVSLGVDRRQRADRPGPRLRQEHLALARADPAPRRDGRDRLAGAGVAVQQGLRGRDPRPAGGRAAGRHAGRDRGQRLARRAGLPRARGRRDPAGARHGRQHPRHPAARRGSVRGLA